MSAVISSCEKYRYLLTREFGFTGEGALCFVMLNPSTADAENDDPTIRRCIAYAKDTGHARVHVVNLFGYRATNPDELYAMSKANAVGPENDNYILDTIRRSRLTICAWGNHGKLFGRGDEIRRLIGCVTTPHALKLNKASGEPSHPLYLKSELRPFPLASLTQP